MGTYSYIFFDSDSDSECNSHGPDLMHFRTFSIQLIFKLSQPYPEPVAMGAN